MEKPSGLQAGTPSQLSGFELLRFWQSSNLSQRQLAKHIGMGFNSLHGKIFREQERLRRRDSSLKTKDYDRVFLRPAIFDIETCNLTAGGEMNFMVCCSILPLGEEDPETIKISFSDAGNDKKLLAETLRELKKYDILIGHNVAAYDFNWLNSRAMYHGLPALDKRWMYYDTYQAARRLAIRAERKSMAFLADFFRVPYIKTAVMPVSWSMIASRNQDDFEDALEDITYHCEQDVLTNRRIFDALWAYDNGGMLNLPFTKKW